MDHPHKFGFIVSSNMPVEVFTNDDLPPDAGDPIPMNSIGGDIVRLGEVPAGGSVEFAVIGGEKGDQCPSETKD